MKNLLFAFFLILGFCVTAQEKKVVFTPVELAENQLIAYNKQDIEAFLDCYSSDVEVYNFPNELVYKGIDNMRERYQNAWAQNPAQKAEIKKRIVLVNTVIDEEFVTGRANGINAHVVAIYKVADNKIKQVYFIRN